MTDLRPIIYNTQQFEEAIEKLRDIARWPLPDESAREFGRRLYHTDAVKAVKIVREVLQLLEQP